MQLYELSYLIHPKVKKEDRDSLQEKMKSFIQDQEGKVTHMIPPSKIELAYPIKDQEKAFLATLLFKMTPSKVEGIKEEAQKEDNILRHLLLKREEEKEKKKRRKKREKEAPAPGKKEEKKAKVELKEIEKKLEEILGQ